MAEPTKPGAKSGAARRAQTDESGADPAPRKPALKKQPPGEVGGAKGPEPTRYGDWQHKGRTTDF